jgi:hypothetical protein
MHKGYLNVLKVPLLLEPKCAADHPARDARQAMGRWMSGMFP